MTAIEQHGITSATVHMGGTEWLKRELLFYDKIGLLYLDASIDELLHGSHPREARATDLEYLRSRNAIYEAEIPTQSSIPETIAFLSNASSADSRFELSLQRAKATEGNTDQVLTAMFDTQAYLSRASAAEISTTSSTIATPIIDPTPFHFKSNETRSVNVARIVLDHFPVPSGNVPFEDILEIRNDAEFVRKRNSLRSWLRNTNASTWTENAIREEIEHLLNEYREYMRVQKIKHRAGTLSGLITLTAETVESLVKLKIKDLVTAGLSIFQENVNLIEAEFSAPGRELSYITTLNDRFRA